MLHIINMSLKIITIGIINMYFRRFTLQRVLYKVKVSNLKNNLRETKLFLY